MYNKINKAFTLAEVLITLGIIGVVAAMTLPTVIANYQKQETVSKLKKSYSIVSQAIKLSEVENESSAYWDTTLSGHNFFEKYLKKYFIEPKELTVSQVINFATRKYLNGNDYNGNLYTGSSASNFLLNDGTMITVYKDNVMWISIDVNGFNNPNVIGKDTFIFFFDPIKGLQPDGAKGSDYEECTNCTREKMLSGSIHSCNTQGTGKWCSYLIFNDGWQMKSDYPW